MDLESIDTVLKTARSVRRKLDFEREVPLALIEDCIDVATQAPVPLAGESWRFVADFYLWAKQRQLPFASGKYAGAFFYHNFSSLIANNAFETRLYYEATCSSRQTAVNGRKEIVGIKLVHGAVI